MLMMTALHIANALLGVGFALGFRGVVDSAAAGDRDLFLRACIIQGAIVLGLVLSNAGFRHFHDSLLHRMDRDWKQLLLHRLLHSDYSAVTRFHSAELLNRMNNDVRVLTTGLLEAIPNVAAMLTRLIAAMAVLAALEPAFAILICLFGCLIILGTGLLRRNLKKLHKLVSEHDGIVSGFLQETLEKLLMIQAMDVSAEVELRADRLTGTRYQIQQRKKNIGLMANTGISFLSLGGSFGALLWCSGKLLRGQLSFGSLTAVIQLVNQLQAPFANLSAVIPKFIAMTAAAERMMELDDLEQDEAVMDRSAAEVYASMTAITAKGLSFSYDRDVVLDNADFSLPKGSFAVITGPSGIGKSTLLKLLLGIFRPVCGGLYAVSGTEELRLDRSTRRLFAYVPQGNLLLSGTLRDNLTITCPDADEEAIREALYVSAMDEYLPQLPMGLDTRLGESGAGLSEGQAQRLAIARAILSGAPILLLDEATSALDEQTELLVLSRIRQLCGKTCIAVTHRPAALELCDWNLELGGGQIRARRNS